MAAAAGWAVLVATEFILLFGVLRVIAMVMAPELLPSLKVVFDIGALIACGWIAGRVGRPHALAAAAVTTAGLALFDLTPFMLLNVPWLLRLTTHAVRDARYLSSFLTTLTMHVLLFGSLLAGAYLSRPRRAPIRLNVQDSGTSG